MNTTYTPKTFQAIVNLNTATVQCHRSTTPPTTPTEIPRRANVTTTDFVDVPSNHNATTSTISVTPTTSSPTPTPFPLLAKIVIPAAIVAIILVLACIGFWNKDEIRRYVIKHPENEPVPA